MDKELIDMILDHMDKGFLENIIDMFKHDETLYPVLILMLRDERMRVRIGATALVEELVKDSPGPFVRLIPELGELLGDPNPTVRGDAANILGIIRHHDALTYLTDAQNDADFSVREIVKDAIEEISRLPQSVQQND